MSLYLNRGSASAVFGETVVPIEFVCPSCFRPYSAPDDVAGRAMSCAGCASSFTIPLVKVPALPPEPGAELELIEAEVIEPVPAPPAPPPKVVVWREPERAAPDDRDEEDEDEDEDEEAWLAREKRKEDRERAKFWFWVKLALIIVCLVGIVVGVRIGLNRVDEVREHNKQMKGKPPR